MSDIKREHSADRDYDHLDIIKSETQIKHYFGKLSRVSEDTNPNTECEAYLREKISKLQGILAAFNQRKQYVKTYITKHELRITKQEKLLKA